MTAYQSGFVSKCEEAGLDEHQTASLLKVAEDGGIGDFGQYTDAVRAYAPKSDGYDLVRVKPDGWIARNVKRYGPSFLLRLGIFGKHPGFVYKRSF